MDFQKLERICREKGISEVEIYHIQSDGSEVSTFNGNADQNTVYSKNEMFVRGVYGGHIVSLYVEKDTDDELEKIADRIKANAGVIESTDPYFIYGGSKEYPVLPEETHDYDKYTQADKLALCRKMEAFVKSKSEFVSDTEAGVEVESETVTIENSNGLSVSRKDVGAVAYCAGVIKKDGDVKQGYYVDYLQNLSDVNYDDLTKFAVERPLSSIGAASMASGNYPVVFENKMFSSLLSCFLSMFSADAVIKKLSLLGDKLGQKVFGDNITLTDEPMRAESNHKVSFDDEGVAAFSKVIVENGVLKTFLHNLRTAKMLNAEPTGNGFKEGSGDIGVRPTNLCLTGGSHDFDTMISGIQDGVFITQMMGQHAGVNAVSGAFNLQSSGYRIRDGKIAEPVTLIVVSGNIVDVLKNVSDVSTDFKVSGRIGCGSVLVSGLNISGKN